MWAICYVTEDLYELNHVKHDYYEVRPCLFYKLSQKKCEKTGEDGNTDVTAVVPEMVVIFTRI